MPVLRHRLILVVPLLLVALWLRALVPAGWMPVAAPGGVVMTLCNGGAARIVIDAGTRHHDDRSTPADSACALAGIAPPLGADAPHVPPPLVTALIAVAIPAGAVLAAPARHAPRPPSQGPPRLLAA